MGVEIFIDDSYDNFDRDTKGRFIFVYRNPMDVAVSLFNQRKNYGLPNIQFEKFLDNFLKNKKMNWFIFNKMWLENKCNFPILYVKYEELLSDFESSLNEVVGFLNLSITKEDQERIKERCSFEFMKKHEDKFGVQPVEKPPLVYDQFIRKGKTGEGKEQIPEKYQVIFKENYNKLVLPFEKTATKNQMLSFW